MWIFPASDTVSWPLPRSIDELDAFRDPFLLFGWKYIPAVCPSGLWMTRPEEGDEPSFCAAAEKYSTLSGRASGEGGMAFVAFAASLFDLVERSELLREPRGLGTAFIAGDAVCEAEPEAPFVLAVELWSIAPIAKNDPSESRSPGLTGEVAIGMKRGSTMGLVTAVCRAVKNRRGPAGLGMIMTSGKGVNVAV